MGEIEGGARWSRRWLNSVFAAPSQSHPASDGRNTLAEMAAAADALGWAYLGRRSPKSTSA
jgi:hypothetical protein